MAGTVRWMLGGKYCAIILVLSCNIDGNHWLVGKRGRASGSLAALERGLVSQACAGETGECKSTSVTP